MGGFSLKGKDGKERKFKQGLESLANMDADETSAALMPEAPDGSYRRKDLAEISLAGGTSVDEAGRPRSQRAMDGKAWDFVLGPEDDSAEEGNCLGSRGKR